MKVTVRLTVLKDKPYVKTPHFETRSPYTSGESFYCTTGVDSGEPCFLVHCGDLKGIHLSSASENGLCNCARLSPCNVPQCVLVSDHSSADIREATRSAVRHMISFLVAEHGLSSVEAYMLCSVAGDLRLHEVVSLLLQYLSGES